MEKMNEKRTCARLFNGLFREQSAKFVIMKKLLIFGFCLFFALSSKGDNEYQKYCRQLKEKLGIELSVAEEKIRFQTEAPDFIFTFGNMLEELPTLPIFECGPIVNLSIESSVVLMDVEGMIKPVEKSYSLNKKNNIPVITGWMLNNCGLPWTQWYINNQGGVVSNYSKSLSEKDSAILKEKVLSLRNQHEQCIENCELTKQSNCDRIYIVRIPNMEKIGACCPFFEFSHPKTEADVKKNATACYGVEFYKTSVSEPLRMLFFINDNNTSIEKSVASIAKYVKFE